jgi:hypothetical protein
MKPELIDGLIALVEAQRGTVFTEANTDSLKEALALAKSAIPGGRVAEDDAETVREFILAQEEPSDFALTALSRLAAKAQGYEAAVTGLADITEAVLGEHPIGAMPGTTLDAVRKIMAERDAVVADNAALLDALTKTRDELDEMVGVRAGDALRHAINMPHPGTALLEEHRNEVSHWRGRAKYAEALADENAAKAVHNAAALQKMEARVSDLEARHETSVAEISRERERANAHWRTCLEREATIGGLEANAARAVETLGGRPGEELQHCAERVRYEMEQIAKRASDLNKEKSELVNGLALIELRAGRAERALRQAGFEDRGGAEWVPPTTVTGGPLNMSPEEWESLARKFADEPRQPVRLMERDTLSIRDEFAKAAMQGILANHERRLAPEASAREAYAMADKMMAERVKR